MMYMLESRFLKRFLTHIFEFWKFDIDLYMMKNRINVESLMRNKVENLLKVIERKLNQNHKLRSPVY